MVWQSIRLSLGSVRAPGPGFFPFCLGLILVALAALIFFKALRKEPHGIGTGLRSWRVAIALGAIFAYAFVLESLGYLLSTFLLMGLLLKLMVKKVWWFTLGIACFVSLASYFLFKVWLKVALPSGFVRF